MTDRELMQMALDALDLVTDLTSYDDEVYEAIDALRARLAQPEPEPVAWMCPDDPERETAFSWKAGYCVDCGKQRVPIYTAPPQREWQGMTDEEITETLKRFGLGERAALARAIEAKLKEKNGF